MESYHVRTRNTAPDSENRIHDDQTAAAFSLVWDWAGVAGDPQMRNPSGTSFPLNGGVLAIAELQYSYPSQGTLVQAGQADPLSRTYKVGFWYDSESFADMRFDNTGLPLADPASSGVPASHRGDYAFYAVADQMSTSGLTSATRSKSR